MRPRTIAATSVPQPAMHPRTNCHIRTSFSRCPRCGGRQAGGSALRNAHFYRRVPKELSEGSALGGLVSLIGILVSLSLVYSNAAT